MIFNPQPKHPPVRLSKKEYREMKDRVYKEQGGMCKVCGFWMHPFEASWHHTQSGGIGLKGDDDKGYLTHLLCHPPKKKVNTESEANTHQPNPQSTGSDER